MFDLSQHFNAYVLTVKGWENSRLHPFLERCAELGVTGIDKFYSPAGDRLTTPNWWEPNRRKWSCHMAHVGALLAGMSKDNGKPIIIFEDDAYLKRNFVTVIRDVIKYFNEHESATVVFLGGKVHDIGDQVTPYVHQNVMVGGGWAYVVDQEHAAIVTAYMMDDPSRDRKSPPARAYVNDTKMMYHAKEHGHAVTRPTCVGHRGGESVILKRNRNPIDM